jgi:hypothetical protein
MREIFNPMGKLLCHLGRVARWLDGENVEVTGTIDPENDPQVVRCSSILVRMVAIPPYLSALK